MTQTRFAIRIDVYTVQKMIEMADMTSEMSLSRHRTKTVYLIKTPTMTIATNPQRLIDRSGIANDSHLRIGTNPSSFGI
jgi:hypothetical protein